jgi:pyrimidine-nucleoside phosphorylase
LQDFAKLFEVLRAGNLPEQADIQFALRGGSRQRIQLAALATHLALSPVAKRHDYGVRPPAGGYLESAGLASGSGCGDPYINTLLKDTAQRRPLGRDRIRRLVSGIVTDDLDPIVAAVWLVIVAWRGLSQQDVTELTLAMASSGRIYDYRGDPRLNSRRLIRRYATGAVSEKVALILPALIASASSDCPVATPFLIGKSLSFTGGTWDKLACIPGFRFPRPGDETVRALEQAGAAMTVTVGDLCPADRALYQLRGATGTVDSAPLIVSSIASKQLASPAHRLLLDVRFGAGAFLELRAGAAAVGAEIATLVETGGTSVDLMLTDTPQPTGTAIGNSLEVAEALAILSPTADLAPWDSRALSEQRTLVIKMYAKLLSSEFPTMDEHRWRIDAAARLDSGRALAGFQSMLRAHHVSSAVVSSLTSDPFATLVPHRAITVRARSSGWVAIVDQKRLGSVVNLDLRSGTPVHSQSMVRSPGILLHARAGDKVDAGSPLCSVFLDATLSPDSLQLIESSFDLTSHPPQS